MSKFSLLNKFIVEQGKNEDLVDILLEAAESMEILDECEMYVVSIADNEPNAVYVYEMWTEESAHQASLDLEATQKLISRAKPPLARNPPPQVPATSIWQ